jgi:hypothetical protein
MSNNYNENPSEGIGSVGLVPADATSKQWLQEVAKQQAQYPKTTEPPFQPTFYTLDDIKAYDIKQDEMRVYSLQRRLQTYIIEARLIANELSYRGVPPSEKETKDLNELSFRSV